MCCITLCINYLAMKLQQLYDVIIIGGSYAGLSAAMALGRSLRSVLVIDSGNPCNTNAPYAHNFITNDGSHPTDIAYRARQQVLAYPTVHFLDGLATDVLPNGITFEVLTADNQNFTAHKIIFATGVTDLIPNIKGFAECWGKTILHCPYCHGFESANKVTGIVGNGDMGFEMAKTISNWTDKLTLYTNGTSTLSPDEVMKLNSHNIVVVENEIDYIEESDGQIKKLHFKDTDADSPDVIYTQLPFKQQCDIPEKLGLQVTDKGLIYISKCLETSIPGIYAAGDCTSLLRSLANATAAGSKLGALLNKCLIDERF